jgi:hypothetical protein
VSRPTHLRAAIAEAQRREVRILDLQRAIRTADGPDEREAAQARLNAFLDELDERDSADLARLV